MFTAPDNESLQALFTSFCFPPWRSIKPLRITEFRAAYLISLGDGTDLNVSNSPGAVVLRVSSKHFTRVKTLNEVASVQWVQQHTTIPVPRIFRWDASTNNPLGYEYTLSEFVPGKSINEVYYQIDDGAKEKIVRQLTDYIFGLHEHSWKHIGSLSIAEDNEIVPGPPFDVHCWQNSDITKYWDSTETFESLNVAKCCRTYSEYLVEHLKKCKYVLDSHPALSNWRYAVPRIDTAIEVLQDDEVKPDVNKTRFVLAHKDLHFANVVVDETSHDIKAVLDWELAQIMPIQQWNPGNFLWNGLVDESAEEEKEKLMSVFEKIAHEREALSPLEEEKPSCEIQEEAKDLVDVLRAICTAVVRGIDTEKLEQWKTLMDELFESFEEEEDDNDDDDDYDDNDEHKETKDSRSQRKDDKSKFLPPKYS